MIHSEQNRTHNIKFIAAFAAVYIIWGSTYLAIRFVVDEFPPFLSGGVRFLVAGALLFTWHRLKGVSTPGWTHWKSALVSSSSMILVGHGIVLWAVQFMPSGITALLVSTVPLWMTVMNMFRSDSNIPKLTVFFGLVIGLSGIALLVNPFDLQGANNIDLFGALALIVASIFWAAGSIYMKNAKKPESFGMGMAIQMLLGGVLLTAVSFLTGEFNNLALSNISVEAVIAFVYLIIFGSLIAFSAYGWLVKHTEPSIAGTYAFVNPVIALFLGAMFAGEALNATNIVAATIILLGVVLITLGNNGRRKSRVKPLKPISLGPELQNEAVCAEGDS